MLMSNTLFIIDFYGFIFRAYHSYPELTSNNTPVGTIFGITSMLLKFVQEFDPKNVVLVLDSEGKNFRHDVHQEYKAHRPDIDESLKIQLKLFPKLFKAFNFHILQKKGFEADDIIASLVRYYSHFPNTQKKRKIVIVSSDKDLMQLIDDYILIYDPIKMKYFTKKDVFEKFGVYPEKLRDLFALVGDKSDNIPGVKGIGPKIALKLLDEFCTIDNLLQSTHKVSNDRIKNLLQLYSKELLISWQLLGLRYDVSIEYDKNDFMWQGISVTSMSQFLKEFAFKSLFNRVHKIFNLSITQEPKPQKLEQKFDIRPEYKIIDTEELLYFIKKNIYQLGVCALHLKEVENGIWLYLSFKNTIFYDNSYKDCIYRAFIQKFVDINSENLNLFTSENNEIDQNLYEKIYLFCIELFESREIKKITFHLKEILHIKDKLLKIDSTKDIKASAFEDVSLMDYCLTGLKNKDFVDILNFYYSIALDKRETQICLPNFIDLYFLLETRLFEEKMMLLYLIDKEICHILYYMEKVGICVDSLYLKRLSDELAAGIYFVEKKIFELSGENFNISSTKQLSEVLFQKMKLPFSKISAKSKNYSTSTETLEKLDTKQYPIIKHVLEYKRLIKLKNTYTDSIPKYIKPLTQRVHSCFLQNSTNTGRLSSIHPNLQNIPIKTHEGMKIRKSFAATKNFLLLSCDYSQIELRILSHVGSVTKLQNAFKNDLDIHTQTASEIFSLPNSKITQDLRYKAKTVNFSIIYGISAFSLANRLNVSKFEAQEYIDRYFLKYPEIKEYMNETVKFAESFGYVQNLLGRKCYVTNILSKNFQMRTFSQRAAINAPIQSLASDIVKIAMIKLYNAIMNHKLSAKIILQIHDELVLEVKEDHLLATAKIVKEVMENAFQISVPMRVTSKYGQNLQELSVISQYG